jgi:hypothetical protein
MAFSKAAIRFLGPCVTLERQQYIRDLLPPTWLLHVGDLAAATVSDAGLRDLRRVERVVVLDILRPHDAGELELADLEVDADLLLALDDEVAVRQELRDDRGDMVFNCSERLTEPLPSLDEVLDVLSRLPGLALLENGVLPKMLETEASWPLVNPRCVSLATLALSVKFTFTVRMSPT